MPTKPLDSDDRENGARRATAARVERAAIKRDLKRGVLRFQRLLERAESDRVVARMPVVDVLAALPAHGPHKAATLMQAAGIAPNRRLGGLGSRQRQALITLLKGRS